MAEGATHSDRLLQGPDESMCGCAAAWNSVSACVSARECVRVDEGEGLGWREESGRSCSGRALRHH